MPMPPETLCRRLSRSAQELPALRRWPNFTYLPHARVGTNDEFMKMFAKTDRAN